MGRVGKHGNSGGLVGICTESDSSIFYGSIELLLGGKFVDATVSERKNYVIFFANEATGKVIRPEREVVLVSDEDIA
jgi:hypothetical protein